MGYLFQRTDGIHCKYFLICIKFGKSVITIREQGTCGMQGGEENSMQSFGGKT